MNLKAIMTEFFQFCVTEIDKKNLSVCFCNVFIGILKCYVLKPSNLFILGAKLSNQISQEPDRPIEKKKYFRFFLLYFKYGPQQVL
jgi:hypothetical protein